VTPAEIIAQRAAHVITTEEMMDKLLSWSYTFGSVPCIDGVATDAYVAGDWDGVMMAFYLDQLSEAEFERIAHHAQSQIPGMGHAKRLAATGFTLEEVAVGLEISDLEVRRLRVARELWAVPDGLSWRFPAAQFDIDLIAHRPIRQVHGLARVLAALPAGLHPAAIEGFLHSPQPDLFRDRQYSPLKWLRGGGDVDAAVRAALTADWYGR
jgi:hypothetical protein